MARRPRTEPILGEAIPDAEFSNDLELLAPTSNRISGSELSPKALPEAWEGGNFICQ